jgi:hypothetical protein
VTAAPQRPGALTGATLALVPAAGGVPTYAVSVIEFTDDLVTHETQYFADPFQAPPWRAALAEPIPRRDR